MCGVYDLSERWYGMTSKSFRVYYATADIKKKKTEKTLLDRYSFQRYIKTDDLCVRCVLMLSRGYWGVQI